MKKTFTTMMPDKVGAFLTASRIFTSQGLNITRVSYNKAVDTHMLFIEAEGNQESVAKAAAMLKEIGYLQDSVSLGNVIIIEFRLKDRPGAVQPILEIISNYNINISYLSSQENGSEYQYFRMGLFVEDGKDISDLLNKAAQLCDVKIINYNPTGIALDNTVFYVAFANRIAMQNKLNDEEKKNLVVDSNLIMDMLTRQDSPPYKTFEYIGKFAEYLMRFSGDAFKPRISEYILDSGVRITLMEPPCGSNIAIIETDDGFLCVDSGFPCYHDESVLSLRRLFPNFENRPKNMLLTHADVDHIGLVNIFDNVFLSKKCYDNFVSEQRGIPNLREQNPAHAPYVRISKILSHYKPVSLKNLRIIGGADCECKESIERIGNVDFGNLHFDVYEAMGGHVQGETIFIEYNQKLAFTGDIIVNTKGFTKTQAQFNRLAPFLMTSVDTNPKMSAEERQMIMKMLTPGDWTIFGGHGEPMKITV